MVNILLGDGSGGDDDDDDITSQIAKPLWRPSARKDSVDLIPDSTRSPPRSPPRSPEASFTKAAPPRPGGVARKSVQEKLFEKYDADGSGEIDQGEMTRLLIGQGCVADATTAEAVLVCVVPAAARALAPYLISSSSQLNPSRSPRVSYT